MRWIVMAQNKVYMTINYALMVEVQKTLKGYRFKLQYDSRALSDEQVEEVLQLFEKIEWDWGEWREAEGWGLDEL